MAGKDTISNVSKTQKIKRRTFIIDKAFQTKFLLTWLILTIFFVAIVFFFVFLGIKLEQQTISDEKILRHISQMLKYNAMFIIFIAFFISIYLIIMSHRIAGPVFRLKRCLDGLRNGVYENKIILRKKDYLKDLAEAVSNLSTFLCNRHTMLIELGDKIKRMREEVDNIEGNNEIKAKLREIEDSYRNIMFK